MPYFLTKEGLIELQGELNRIVEQDLPVTLESLNSAREEGDLKENAGYQTAIKVRDELVFRQTEIEDILKDYQIIEENTTNNRKVQIGSHVKLETVDQKQILEFRIVGTSESDVLAGKISNESPLALAILNKTVGDIAEYKTPNGKIKVKILEIN